MTPTLEELSPFIKRLGPLRVRSLLRFARNGHVPEKEVTGGPGRPLSPGEALLLTAAAFLSARKIITDEQQQYLLEELAPSLVAHGDLLAERKRAGSKAFPVLALCLGDRRFAWLPGTEGALDLQTGEKLPRLQGPPVEIIQYDMVALYFLVEKKLEEERAKPAAGASPARPSPGR